MIVHYLWQRENDSLHPGKWTNCWKGLIPCVSQRSTHCFFSRFGFPSSWLEMNHQESRKLYEHQNVLCFYKCTDLKKEKLLKRIVEFHHLVKGEKRKDLQHTLSDLTCHIWLVTGFVTFKQSNQLYHPRYKMIILYIIYHVFYKLFINKLWRQELNSALKTFPVYFFHEQ